MAHHKEDLIIFDDTQPLVSIENKRIINGTVELKAVFIRNSQLAGVLVDSIDMDDYTGRSCHRGAFPITSIVSRVFSKSTTSEPTTVEINAKEKGPCLGVTTNDLIPDENDCNYYYVCTPNNNKPIARLQCPNGMHFSSTQKACTHEESVSFENLFKLIFYVEQYPFRVKDRAESQSSPLFISHSFVVKKKTTALSCNVMFI